MKTSLLIVSLISFSFILIRCGQKSTEHDTHHHEGVDSEETGKNKELYENVMKVHDEAMPKMDDIYKIKEALKNKIAAAPDMSDDKKKEIENTISRLDSANEGMMDWMRKFKPLPDSTDEEAAREYLESEMVKVTKVKEDMLQAIDKGNALK